MSPAHAIWYVYPMWHTVSFTLIARKHIEQLRKYMRVHEVDELAFPHITPHSRPLVVVHPFFFIMGRLSKHAPRKLHMYRAIIGIDVADSDKISELAVSMTNYARVMVVPSQWARMAYLRSGVTVPVEVVPHGLDREWYRRPRSRPRFFTDVARLRERRGLKLILFFLWHSAFRKGWDLVFEWYVRLRRERRDVLMVLKTGQKDSPEAGQCRAVGCIHIAGWLSEEQKMELYDLADLYPLFTRGGGFEMNGLEALARLVPAIAAAEGSWTDYMPGWLLVPYRYSSYVLKDNPIHVGRGVEVDIEKAVDLAHKILDNLDEYRARLEEWRERVLAKRFTWEYVGRALRDIIVRVAEEV